MNKGEGGGKVFEDDDYFHDPTRDAKAPAAQQGGGGGGGGKDGGRPPPPSLSAPATACHSPLAAHAPENGFPNPIPAATEEDSASNRRSSRKTSTTAATATATFARLFEHVKRTMKDKVMNVKKGGGGHERENKMLRELFKQVEVQQEEEEERVVEACKCWLSTTAGLIPGDLFISTHRLAFCSHKSINLHSSTHGIIAAPYKVSIPLHMIQESASNSNSISISISNPPDKFLKIVTLDNYDFWFKVNSNHTLAALSNSILSSASASLPA